MCVVVEKLENEFSSTSIAEVLTTRRSVAEEYIVRDC